MKVAIVLLGILAVCSAQNYYDNVVENLDDYEIDITDVDFENLEEEIFDPSSRLFVISWKVRHELRKLQKEMPCGFPEYGIPPLAPIRKSDIVLSLKKGFLE